MDLALQHAHAAQRPFICWSDPWAQGHPRAEPGVGHPQRGEDALLYEGIERLLGDRLDHEPGDDRTEVGVEHGGAGRVFERRLKDLETSSRRVGRRAPDCEARGEPRVMREELPHRDLLLAGADELREIGLYRGVEAESPLIVEDHRGGGGRDDFGEGGEIVDRLVRTHGPRMLVPADAPIALLPDGEAAPADDHCGTRIGADGDPAADDPVHRGEARGRHVNGARRGGGDPITEGEGRDEGEEGKEHRSVTS